MMKGGKRVVRRYGSHILHDRRLVTLITSTPCSYTYLTLVYNQRGKDYATLPSNAKHMSSFSTI